MKKIKEMNEYRGINHILEWEATTSVVGKKTIIISFLFLFLFSVCWVILGFTFVVNGVDRPRQGSKGPQEILDEFPTSCSQQAADGGGYKIFTNKVRQGLGLNQYLD